MRVFNQRKKILAVHGLFRSAPGPVGVRWAVPMGATSSSGCSCLFNPEQNVGFFPPLASTSKSANAAHCQFY